LTRVSKDVYSSKIAIFYDYKDKGREAVIKYLKHDKPFGPLRTVKLNNFISTKS
jgi:hypothetical protein